jgi:hypothetical protein
MDGPVAIVLSAVPGEWSVRRFDKINLPVKADLSEVLLLLLLVLPPRNLSSPIPRPGNAPVDPMWNLGDVLVMPLFTSTTSFTPSCPLNLISELSVVGSADGGSRACRLARSSRGDISSSLSTSLAIDFSPSLS